MSAAENEVRDFYVRLRTALQSAQPVPEDVRCWLLSGINLAEARGQTLDQALNLGVASGRAHRRPCRLIPRAKLESDILKVADCIGPRDGRTAARIERALADEPGAIPSVALDFLTHALYQHGDRLPRSRTAIARILTGQTQPARLGLVQKA